MFAYVAAVGLSVLLLVIRATALQGWLGPGNPFIQSYPAIVAAAVLGGTAPGLVATLISAAGVWYLYFATTSSLPTSTDVAGLLFFLVVGGFISLGTGVLKASQRAALASEQRYRKLVELSPVAVLIIYRQRIVFANQSMCRLVAAPNEAALKDYQPQKLVHDDSRPAARSRREELSSGRIAHAPWIEEKWVRLDGTVVPVEVAAMLVPWEDGMAMQILTRDLTSEKQSRERQQALLAAAENANRTKDEFLATLSHELRTPLNAVRGWTQMLLGSSPDPRSLRGLEVIRRNAEALQVLVEEILELSVIVSGQLRLDTAPVDLRAIVKSAIESVAPTAAAKGIVITVPASSTPIVVIGDSRRLQQVLWNLLANAVKFTGTSGKVEVSMRVENDFAVLTVADTGQGIVPEFLPHVFEAFRQEDSTSTRVITGLGLGLALVRRLVEAHGGTVRAHSEGRDLGAVFTITLPLAPASPSPARGSSNDVGELVPRR